MASGVRLGSFVPEGHLRIARRFNAGEATKRTLVSKGRLRTLLAFNRPFGTDLLLGAAHPALKRRAIVGSPFGAKRRRGLTDSSNRSCVAPLYKWAGVCFAAGVDRARPNEASTLGQDPGDCGDLLVAGTEPQAQPGIALILDPGGIERVRNCNTRTRLDAPCATPGPSPVGPLAGTAAVV